MRTRAADKTDGPLPGTARMLALNGDTPQARRERPLGEPTSWSQEPASRRPASARPAAGEARSRQSSDWQQEGRIQGALSPATGASAAREKAMHRASSQAAASKRSITSTVAKAAAAAAAAADVAAAARANTASGGTAATGSATNDGTSAPLSPGVSAAAKPRVKGAASPLKAFLRAHGQLQNDEPPAQTPSPAPPEHVGECDRCVYVSWTYGQVFTVHACHQCARLRWFASVCASKMV